METWQMERIEELRRENYSYKFIGDVLGISPNTVKSVCRRKNYIALGNRKTKKEKQNAHICKNCGSFFATTGRSGQQFCSDSCRRQWWKKNRKVTVKKTC